MTGRESFRPLGAGGWRFCGGGSSDARAGCIRILGCSHRAGAHALWDVWKRRWRAFPRGSLEEDGSSRAPKHALESEGTALMASCRAC